MIYVVYCIALFFNFCHMFFIVARKLKKMYKKELNHTFYLHINRNNIYFMTMILYDLQYVIC